MRKSDGVRTEEENKKKKDDENIIKKNQDFLLKLKGNFFIFLLKKIMF